jgi:hypothetical protein
MSGRREQVAASSLSSLDNCVQPKAGSWLEENRTDCCLQTLAMLEGEYSRHGRFSCVQTRIGDECEYRHRSFTYNLYLRNKRHLPGSKEVSLMRKTLCFEINCTRYPSFCQHGPKMLGVNGHPLLHSLSRSIISSSAARSMQICLTDNQDPEPA